MQNKPTIKSKEDAANLIEDIISQHGANSPKIILDELLKHYNHKLLLDIIKGNSDKKSDDNDFMVIAIKVYVYVYNHAYSVKRAIKQVSDETFMTEATKGIKETTVRRHVETFRGKIKRDLKDVYPQGCTKENVDWFIRRFIDSWFDGSSGIAHSDKLRIRELYNDLIMHKKIDAGICPF